MKPREPIITQGLCPLLRRVGSCTNFVTDRLRNNWMLKRYQKAYFAKFYGRFSMQASFFITESHFWYVVGR